MGRWLNERLHVNDLMEVAFEHPVPKSSSLLDFLGFVTLFIFINQAVTGILLATIYVPSAAEAYNSIKLIQSSAIGGYIRSLHSWGANFMVVLIALHLLRVFYESAYKKPRELTWIMGGILLIATLGLAFTGYLLPWDQEGYWATTVGTAMPSYIPFVGDYIVQLLRNGEQVTGATLTRFYSVHMLVLPLLVLLAFIPHFFFVLRQGMCATDELAEAKLRGENIDTRSVPFWPNVAFRMITLVLVVAIALWVLAGLFPITLGNAADPLNKHHYIPTPAWYFFGAYQLLKYFPGSLDVVALVALPIVFVIVIFGLPWFDRNPSRAPSKRPIALSIAGVVVIGIVFLTYQGIQAIPKPVPDIIITHPSFNKDISLIVNSNCIGCHGKSGGYSMDSYTNTTKKDIIPADPESSTLIKRIEGKVTPQMPFGLDPLTNNQIQNIKNWIQDGAKNN